MKSTNKILIVCLASIGLLGLASPAQAQYKPTGDDGITASPRVRAQLAERNAKTEKAPAIASSMACARCSDQLIAVPNKDTKAAQSMIARGVPTPKVARHLCAVCKTTIGVTGAGKAKHDVVNHKCSTRPGEVASCCSKAQ